LGVPLNFYGAGLILTPNVGLYIGDLSVFNAIGDTPTGIDLHAGLDFGWALGQYLYLNGGSAWGWKSETSKPDTADYHALSGELNLSTSLGFIKTYPFRYSSLRLYGKAEWIYDDNSNLIYAGAADLNVGVLRVEEPYVELNLVGSFVYQDSAQSATNDDYYAPDDEILAVGGLETSVWIPVSDASTVNVGLRAVAGAAREEGASDLDPKMEIEGNLGFSKGDSYYYVRSAYNAVLTAPFDLDSGEYWSFYLGLGFSSQLPSLLAP
jgi:hypothetical protein